LNSNPNSAKEKKKIMYGLVFIECLPGMCQAPWFHPSMAINKNKKQKQQITGM
jgi:hypothetical protein